MAPTLNFFDTYILMAITEEIVPRASFFRDRYFPTGEGDIFAADKVLTEYRKGDRKMAAFVSERVGDIPMERRGYEIHEYQPAFIAPSRLMTLDDLKKRGFGEALYPGMTKAQRAAKLQQKDLQEMDGRTGRREEWMAVQTMIHNACPMQEYVDAKTKGKPGWTELISEERYGAKTMKIKSKNMSDGMLRLLAFLAICEMDPCTMLLDEIENGINLDYAEQIVHILDENCKSKNNQLIVTTHSPIFLDYVQKENIRYLYREPASGNCKCSSLAQNTELNEKLQYLYPGELFMNMSNKDINDILLKQEGQSDG